jgi:hypothetical protein
MFSQHAKNGKKILSKKCKENRSVMLLHYRSSKHDRSTYSRQPLQQKIPIEFYIEKGIKIDKSINSADVQILNIQEKIIIGWFN